MSTETRKRISEKYCPRFGHIAVEKGYITTDQLKSALNIQVDENIAGVEHRLLGTILFEKDWMSSEQIEVVLNLLLGKVEK